ncbi:DUF7269 family protein [Halorientalis salina]|uniref:DUF7269 family protein n=1 Tax=Halorientalis salina TaxID=2932266 RepID=UPI0010AC5AD8|nr:hypothetical protein [Halorientalis salina]
MASGSIDSDGSNWRHVVLGAGGIIALVALFLVADDIAGPAGTLLRTAVDNEYLLAMALGAVALLLAGLVFFTGRNHLDTTSMPAAEKPVPASTPGDPLESQLDSLRAWIPMLGTDSRTEARTRLRRATVLAVAADRGCSNSAATQAVDEGTWTDDSVAARFLGTDGHRSPGVVVAAATRGQTPLHYRVRRTIHVLAAMGEPMEESS